MSDEEKYTVKLQFGMAKGDIFSDDSALRASIVKDTVIPLECVFFVGSKNDLRDSLKNVFDGFISILEEGKDATGTS